MRDNVAVAQSMQFIHGARNGQRNGQVAAGGGKSCSSGKKGEEGQERVREREVQIRVPTGRGKATALGSLKVKLKLALNQKQKLESTASP